MEQLKKRQEKKARDVLMTQSRVSIMEVSDLSEQDMSMRMSGSGGLSELNDFDFEFDRKVRQ